MNSHRRLPFTCHVIGIMLCLFSFSLVIPMLLSLYYDDGAALGFLAAMFIPFAVGIFLRTFSVRQETLWRTRDAILITLLSWLSLSFFAALPFILIVPTIHPVDAWFEAVSGLTTTGSSILRDISILPLSLLFYRQFLQWIGGMGIILLALAILPLIGVGGMQLYRSEIPGPVKDNKLTPRITETAKFLWLIYLVLTFLCAAAYALAGMSLFDAVTPQFFHRFHRGVFHLRPEFRPVQQR